MLNAQINFHISLLFKSMCVYELHFIFNGVLVKSTEIIGAFQNHVLVYNPLLPFFFFLIFKESFY